MMIDIENLEAKFYETVNSKEWDQLQQAYNECHDIYVLGHGGNMAIADHTAVDMTRLSNGTKNAMCPGSCVVATSLINGSCKLLGYFRISTWREYDVYYSYSG